MSQTDLSKLLDRAASDPILCHRLFQNFSRTLMEEGYQLTESEIESAKRDLSDVPNPPRQPYPPFPTNPGPPPEFIQRQMEIGLTRMADLSSYTVEILKTTLNNAARTFKTITWMNIVMFGVGIGLFVVAAVYGVVAERKVYSLLFGGLGTLSFAVLFLLGPIERSQNALSNLVQVEISFMNYFAQMGYWETYAMRLEGFPPMPTTANIEKASEMLQERAKDTIELLQKYVEVIPKK